MAASVRRSSAQAARLSRRSVYISAAPADASAIVVVTSMTTISLPARLRRALHNGQQRIATDASGFENFTIHLRCHCAASCLHIGNTFHCNRLCPTRTRSGGMELPQSAIEPHSYRPVRARLLLIAVAGFIARWRRPRSFRRRRQGGLSVPFRAVRRMARGRAADAPFVIAVSGAEDVAVQLERLLPGMTVHGRPRRSCAGSRARRSSRACTSSSSARCVQRARARCARVAIEKPILIVTEQRTRPRRRRASSISSKWIATCDSRFR